MTQATALTPADDAFHVPATDDPWWQESTWFYFFVPERRLSCTLYPWVRPNQHLLGGGVMMWDDRGRTPWDALHWNYEWNYPYPDPGDLRDITFPMGISVRCLEPMRTYRLGYEHPNCTIDVTWSAIVDPHAVLADDDGMGAWAGHVDQQGRVTGRLVVGGEEIAVDCCATRDRSWGRRVPHPGLHVGFDVAVGPEVGFVTHTDERSDGSPLDPGRGYLWRDAEQAPIASGRRILERDGVWPSRIVIEATDTRGRSIEAVGEPVNWIACQNIPTMMNLMSLTRYEVTADDGSTSVLWGDIQDVWHVDEYRAFARHVAPPAG